MAHIYATVVLLLAATALASATALRPRRNLQQHTVLAPVNTTKGGVHHSYWFQHLFNTKLSEPELACARNATFLYKATGRCEWLFEQGPCAPHQWLVLAESNEGGGLRATCRSRPCAPGYGFLVDERRCVQQEQLCAGEAQAQRVFRYSLRGDGRCHCKGFRAQGPDGACHLLFHQGPCAQGQVLTPAYNRSFGACVGACASTACEEGKVQMEDAANARGHSPTTNKDCAEFSDLDCSPQMLPLLNSEADIQVPLCDYTQRSIFVAPRRAERCLRDATGRCMEVVILSPGPFQWRTAPTSGGGRLATTYSVLHCLCLCVAVFLLRSS